MALNTGNDAPPPRLRPPRLRPVFALAFCLVFGLGCGMLFDRWELQAFIPRDAVPNFQLIAEAWNKIQRYYVDRAAVDSQSLTYGAISGMVDALNDRGHSVFLPPDMVKRLHSTEKGEPFKGIGVQFQIKNRQLVIVAPIKNSPAQKAGLRSGEIILSINGRDVAGIAPNDVGNLISGPEGSTVELGVLNPGTQRVRNVSIVRASIKVYDVTWHQLPGTPIADLRISGFEDGTGKNVRKALEEIQQAGLRGLILDLRDNPGGILDESAVVASQFLSGGNVLLVKDANGNTNAVPVTPGGLATNLPMAVLINFGTASASEIVAGALGAAHRAELIGQTTFGTGTVLNEFPLSGGSAMLLAIEEWLTPDGQSFWHKGLDPQISVALPDGVYMLVPANMDDMTPADFQKSSDKQLLQAVQWVQQQIQSPGPGN